MSRRLYNYAGIGRQGLRIESFRTMIEFKNVTKKYGENVGLIDASVHIKRGDFVFLVGPSGAGKTTFIRLILKEIEPDKGKIFLAGKDITRIGRREIPAIRQKVGMVFQDFRLLEKKTVYENVAFAMEVLHKSKREIRERVPYVLDLVDIKDKAKRYPAELSAGEQQRVGIARALVNKPRVLICDEPTGNLDPNTAMEIMELLEQINIRGTTVLMVTHAKDIVDKMNKRVVAIEHGRIVRDEEGSYGYKKQENQEPHLYIPQASVEAENRQTVYLEQSSQDFTSAGHGQAAHEKYGVDDMVSAYLNGGEDVYE
jgi:cell division transport system ATP-binding protein